MKKSDKILINDATISTIDVIIAPIPPLAIAWNFAKALYWNWLKLRQERALEFVEFIMNNQSEFNNTILQSQEFQDWFVYVLEKYIREKNKEKRIIAQKIFLWFATDAEKENFELERYFNTLELISAEGISYLNILNNNIIPSFIKERAKNPANNLNTEWYNNILSSYNIDMMISLINPNYFISQNVPEYNVESLTELSSLWITTYSWYWNWQKQLFRLTIFWIEFISFLTK